MRQTQNTQKKNNRRSILVIALLLMLVAVIGFGGYTLSKYVTKKEASANASVAKWGFTVDANSDNLFGTQYKFKSANTSTVDGTGTLTVSASDEKTNKVAPGTTGSMTFSVKGSAEVLAQIKFEFTVTSDVVLKYTVGADTTTVNTYAPVKWTLKKGTETLVDGKTLEDVKTALNGKTEEYAPNATAINDEYTLSWAWEFENVTSETAELNNALDTLLGMYANNNATTANGDYKVVADGTKTGIDFALKITIAQLPGEAA